MALTGNGQLLVEVRGQPAAAVFAITAATAGLEPVASLARRGYTVEPLFAGRQHTVMALSPALPDDHWLLAKPAVPAPTATPWDDAHAMAAESNYAHYVEPDILHTPPPPTAAPPAPPPDNTWPPKGPISPGWHLQAGFSGFAAVRSQAQGAGVRIAHLDTGYTPGHMSNPVHLRTDLGQDFWPDDPNTLGVDPHTQTGLLPNPGHGTATLGLLAAGKLSLSDGGVSFDDLFGGAPEAEVVPVRISPSVVHLYTSSMAQGLDYALAPGGNAANQCDAITISHGGLPTSAWAAAVNHLYEAGVVVVAASGDNFNYILDVPTHQTVYPSAFNRVVTALGATYDRTPYITSVLGVMQGNWGPDVVMNKAIAAYTPNVPWMGAPVSMASDSWSMQGSGTSASTPQIAAACALWLGLYGQRLPKDWRRAEACRVALFETAANKRQDAAHLGAGLLDVPAFLAPAVADDVVNRALQGKLAMMGEDEVSFPFLRLLFGWPPPNSAEDQMYETEAAQVVAVSGNPALMSAAYAAATPGTVLTDDDRLNLKQAMLGETLSGPLRTKIAASA